MKDLSREEKLEQEILRMAYEYGDKKWLRVKRTFFVISGAIYLIPFMGGIIGENIKTLLSWLVVAPIMAGFVMLLSYGILFYIIDGAMKDEKAIAKKMGELNAIKLSKLNKE